MTKLSRVTKLLLAARQAARGASVGGREQGIADTEACMLPLKTAVGPAKFRACAKLKERVAALSGLSDIARAALADEIVELAQDIQHMANRPSTDEQEKYSRRHWMDRD